MRLEDILFNVPEETPGLVMPNGDAIESCLPEEALSEFEQLIVTQGNMLDANLRIVTLGVLEGIRDEIRDPENSLDRAEQLSRIFSHVVGSADDAMSFFDGGTG